MKQPKEVMEEEKKPMDKKGRFEAMEQVVNMLSEKLFMDSDKDMDDDDSDEKKEEEMHMDLDNDGEEGESLEHKKKVMPGLFKKGK